MTLYDSLSFFVRLVTILPIGYLLFVLGASYIKTHSLNGLTPVRTAVLLLVVGVGVGVGVRLLGDLHALFGISQSVQEWLKEMKWYVLAAQAVLAVGFWKFAILFERDK